MTKEVIADEFDGFLRSY